MANGFGSGFMGRGNIRIGNGFMKWLPPEVCAGRKGLLSRAWWVPAFMGLHTTRNDSKIEWPV